jgi:hypothetical protein
MSFRTIFMDLWDIAWRPAPAECPKCRTLLSFIEHEDRRQLAQVGLLQAKIDRLARENDRLKAGIWRLMHGARRLHEGENVVVFVRNGPALAAAAGDSTDERTDDARVHAAGQGVQPVQCRSDGCGCPVPVVRQPGVSAPAADAGATT